MKLAFVFNVPFVEYGGKYYSINLTEEFWKKRYLKYFDEIVVVGRVKHVDKSPEHTMTRSDMSGVTFKCIESNGSLASTLCNHKTNKFIIDSIKDCDAVICRSWWGTKACRKLNKPYMIEVITNAWDSLWYHSLKGKFAAIPVYFFQRFAIYRAPFVLYVSKFFLQEKYPTKGLNCGCPDVWLDKPKESVLEKRLSRIEAMDERSITIGMIGSNAVNYRGHDTLMDAAQLLISEGINCNVKFLGGGDPSRWMRYAEKKGIIDTVQFCGSLPHGDPVLEWIDEIDVLVMPTRAESLGRAVIEAMSRACPVLGTIETGLQEQIGADCLFHVNDSKAISSMIKRMAEDKEYMKACAKENFYRSFKYTNEITDRIRNEFYETFVKNAETHSILR